MAVTYEIRFTIASGQHDRFLGLLAGVLDAMRREPMFHRASLHEDPEDDHRFMLVETWEDHDDVITVQLARPYRRAFHEALPEVLATEREISVWRPLRSDDRATPGSMPH
ncbi:MAG TPA: putative quinol monooxygenase [Thermomicrobiales bacterium]|nr:putative quinol monooxygenase [Thermomicrobiales bacterium]